MAPLAALLLALVTLLTAPAAAEFAAASTTAGRCRRVEDVMCRLFDLVDFFAADAGRVNADGYFGLRLSHDLLAPRAVRRALAQLDAECGDSGRAAFLDALLVRQGLLIRRVERSLLAAGRSRYDAVTFVKICSPMAARLRRLINGGGGGARLLPVRGEGGGGGDSGGPGLTGTDVRRLVDYDEPRGDTCLLRALRPGADCSSHSQLCSYFDRPLAQSSGYYLTHQILYKLVDSLKVCWNNPGVEFLGGAAQVGDDLAASCRKIFSEFKMIETANWTRIALETDANTLTGLRDLYMEQALLCGLLGARDFYHRVSVDTVASWQDPELGCFKLYGATERAATSGRRILRDVEMLGGCSAHSSGIAMGFYSSAIRSLLNI